MLVRCKHTGHVHIYIYISLLSWICLIVQFAAITWPLCPNKILETLQHGKVQILSGGFLAEVQRSFQWSKPILQSKKLSDLKLNSPQWLETFSVCITLELASTCSPGRWSQLCKQKRYNSSRLLQVGGRTKSITLLASTKIQPPGSILVGRVQEKKPKPKQYYFLDTWKVMLGVSFITKEKRRPPRIVRIVQMRTNEPAVASSTAILFLLGRPQSSNNTCLTKGPIDLQRNLIHLVTFC